LTVGDGLVDEQGIVYVCPPYGGACNNYQVKNNIIGGSFLAGFYVYSHPCNQEDTQLVFRDNIAHSIDGPGATVFAN